MIRFANILADGLKQRGISVEILIPKPILLGKDTISGKGLVKWMGYVDKWLLFPVALRLTVRDRSRKFGENVSYHICDHSNAPYLAHLPKNQTGITCHDVLAIRGALGFPSAYCAASRTGVMLQKWILKHLQNARRIACVSHLTLNQLYEVAGKQNPSAGWKVVHNAFNAEFVKTELREATQILDGNGIHLPRPFLLHVGSNLPRKNRRMLLQMIMQNGQLWPGHICFAGEPMDAVLTEEAIKLGIQDRVHSVPKPDHKTLCALYSLAFAFIFPSLSEGFGWPLIEAQACGVPVIASNLEPLPEVTGGAALHADPHDAKSFASALQMLNDASVVNKLVEQGLKNSARFGLATMIDGYLDLHALDEANKTRSAI